MFSLYNPIKFLAILYPISLANLVVEVGTKHSHQILLAGFTFLWLAGLNIGWITPVVMDCGIMWQVGISTIFHRPLTVPLHSLNGRQMPAIRAVQGDCEWVYHIDNFMAGK